MRSGAVWTFFLSRMKLTSPFLPSGARARIATRIPTAAGSATLVRPMIRSWPLPGFAQRCSTRSRGVASAIMRENVLLGPAGEVEQGAGWKEVEARLGQRSAVLACEPLVELDLELVKIADVACRIFALRVAQRGREIGRASCRERVWIAG